MPIVYIHGVANRDKNGWKPVGEFLRRYVAGVLNSANPENVEIIPVFWGDVGASFAWDELSRPRTRLAGQGAGQWSKLLPTQRAQLLADKNVILPNTVEKKQTGGSALTSGAAGATGGVSPTRLRDFNRVQLSNLLVTAVPELNHGLGSERIVIALASDDVAHYDGVLSSTA